MAFDKNAWRRRKYKEDPEFRTNIKTKNAEWQADHPEYVLSSHKKWRDSHKDQIREKAMEKAKQNPEDTRAKRLVISRRASAKRKRLREEEAGRPCPELCELCGEAGEIVFDHCHATDKFRGWICQRCNRALGHVKDNINLLSKMVMYLRAFHLSLDYTWKSGKIEDLVQQ